MSCLRSDRRSRRPSVQASARRSRRNTARPERSSARSWEEFSGSFSRRADPMFQPGDVEYMPPSQPQSQQRRAGFGSATSVAATGYFSSPSDLLNAGQQTNDAFMQMFNAVDANRSSANPTVPKSVRDQFVPFAIGWNQFFQQNFSNIALVTARWLTSDLQT